MDHPAQGVQRMKQSKVFTESKCHKKKEHEQHNQS